VCVNATAIASQAVVIESCENPCHNLDSYGKVFLKIQGYRIKNHECFPHSLNT
jgi:hypothetical protein